MFKLLLEGKDLRCSSGLWWGLRDFFFIHIETWKLLENIIGTHYVIQSFVGLWTIDFPIFHFGFLHFILHMFDMFNFE
jgi:hypothetical protein